MVCRSRGRKRARAGHVTAKRDFDMAQQHDWFYASGGVQMGPVDTEGLKRLADAGELKPTDLVWRDGLADWTAASKLPELFPAGAPDGAAAPAATGAYPTTRV